MCLCYGNGLYDEAAAKVYGAVGCPPIHNNEQKMAWKNYVYAVVEHFKGRITYYEIWNEPDGRWCWKHGVNPEEMASLTLITAESITTTIIILLRKTRTETEKFDLSLHRPLR